MKITKSWLITIGALAIYAVSLALPAFECGMDQPFFRVASRNDPIGVLVFMFGWLGVLVGELRWFSNVPFFIMVIQLLMAPSSTKRFVYPALVAPTAISCIFIPARVCGHDYNPSSSLGLGGYLWVTAATLVSVTYIFELAEKLRNKEHVRSKSKNSVQNGRKFHYASIALFNSALEHKGNWQVVKSLYFSSAGRYGREIYWLFGFLPFFVFGILLGLLTALLKLNRGVGVAFAVLLLYPALVVQAKRWHDIGLSGWFSLLTLIPYVGPIVTIVVGLIPGRIGENRYGPNPASE